MGGILSKTVVPVFDQSTQTEDIEYKQGNHVSQNDPRGTVQSQPTLCKDQNSVPNYRQQNRVIPYAEQNNVSSRRRSSSVRRPETTIHPSSKEPESETELQSLTSPRVPDTQTIARDATDTELQSLTSRDNENAAEISRGLPDPVSGSKEILSNVPPLSGHIPRGQDTRSGGIAGSPQPDSTTPKASASETLSELSPRSRLSRTQSLVTPGVSLSQSEATPRLTESQSEAVSPLSRTQSLISPRVHRPLIQPSPVEVTCGRYVPCLPEKAKEKKSKVTGCVYLSNGYLVLVDNRNKRVKLFDPDLKCVSFIDLQHRPFEVCECNGALYITIPKEKEIQVASITFPFLCVARKLILRSVIQTEGECYGITSHKNDLIVGLKFPPLPTEISDFSWQVHVMTTKGAVKQKIMTDSKGRTLFTDAYFLTMAVGKRELIVSEATCDRVKGYNMKHNKKTFNHKIEDPKGLVVDKHNNIYVLGKDASIHWIEGDRKKIHVLLQGSPGMVSSGETITCNSKSNKLLVPRNENKVDIYNLKGKVS